MAKKISSNFFTNETDLNQDSTEYSKIIEKINSYQKFGMKLGLDRMKKWLATLGRPDLKQRVIHIAGTNGKGSTAMTLAYLLNNLGLKVGLYTSPYVINFEERIRVFSPYTLTSKEAALSEGLISREAVLKNYKRLKEVLPKEDTPTFFEWITALAWLYFEAEACDVVILEVGLGGRLDATNTILKPDLCVLTALGYDHTHILGNTLQEIIEEKAGILKENTPLIALYAPELFKTPEELADYEKSFALLERIVKEKNIELHIVDTRTIFVDNLDLEGQAFNFSIDESCGLSSWKTALLGKHQAWNTSLALKACWLWCNLPSTKKDFPHLSKLLLQQADFFKMLKSILLTVKWPGRLDLFNLSFNETLLLDGAHNEEGALILADSLNKLYCGQKIDMICGILADKPIEEMIRVMFERVSYQVDNLYLVSPNKEGRASSVADLYARIESCLPKEARTWKIHLENNLTFFEKRLGNIRDTNLTEIGESASKKHLNEEVKAKKLVIWGSLYLISDIYQILNKYKLL